MARPYSNDLRDRVVARALGGESIRTIAAAFSISPSSVSKWTTRFRTTGSAAPAQFGGYKRVILEAHRAYVHTRFAEDPELTLRGLQKDLASRGIKVSYGAIWSFVHSQGLSFKKTVLASEQDRPDVSRRREQWKTYQARIDPSRLVFIDETWTKTNMAPLRGWSPRGERLIGKAPHGRWRTFTFLAALRHDRIDAPCLFDGPINGERFLAYVRRFLLPTLKPGDLVIMDNLGSHKAKAVRGAIRSVGAKLFFLPPYSPDLNPIEQLFAKLKHGLRHAQERNSDAICNAIGRLLETVKPDQCKNYIVNSGYASD